MNVGILYISLFYGRLRIMLSETSYNAIISCKTNTLNLLENFVDLHVHKIFELRRSSEYDQYQNMNKTKFIFLVFKFKSV